MDSVMFKVLVFRENGSYSHSYHRPFESEEDWELFKDYIQALGYVAECNRVSILKRGSYNEWV